MTTAGPAGRVTAIGPVLYGMVQEREHTRMLLNVNARSVARSCGTSLDFAVCWDGGAAATSGSTAIVTVEASMRCPVMGVLLVRATNTSFTRRSPGST